MRRLAKEEFARQYIEQVRAIAPGLGAVKIWEMYRREMGSDLSIGRDRFCDIYESMGLKLRKKKRGVRTTDSSHSLPTFPNLVKSMIPIRFGQIAVGDITYIPLETDSPDGRDFCYLSLLMDSYNKEIVGHEIGATLETVHSLRALKQGADTYREAGVELEGLIHHTDRGVQYASYDYTDQLHLLGILPSMTENGNPKDNAEAERLNETIKCQMLKGKVFHSLEEVRQAVAIAVDFYNTRRPHDSLEGRTPREARSHTGRFRRGWKSWREEAIDALSESTENRVNEKSEPMAGMQNKKPNFAPSLEEVASGLRPVSTSSSDGIDSNNLIAI